MYIGQVEVLDRVEKLSLPITGSLSSHTESLPYPFLHIRVKPYLGISRQIIPSTKKRVNYMGYAKVKEKTKVKY